MPSERDLTAARLIQDALLRGHPPEMPGMQLAGTSLPAAALGGDYFDFIATSDGRMRVFIGDVMGKGVGAAMLMVMARTAARMASEHAEGPGALLAEINRILYQDLRRLASFVTVLCAEYDPARHTLTCANAGHPYPLVHRAASGQVDVLRARGTMIGALPERTYDQVTIPLTGGDTVLFYTDGLAEVTNPAGEPIRTGGLAEFLRHHGGLPPLTLQERLLGAVRAHAAGGSHRDDLTFAILQPQARL